MKYTVLYDDLFSYIFDDSNEIIVKEEHIDFCETPSDDIFIIDELTESQITFFGNGFEDFVNCKFTVFSDVEYPRLDIRFSTS